MTRVEVVLQPETHESRGSGARMPTRWLVGVALLVLVGGCARGVGDEDPVTETASPTVQSETTPTTGLDSTSTTDEEQVEAESTEDELAEVIEGEPQIPTNAPTDAQLTEILCEPVPLTTSSIRPLPPWSSPGVREFELQMSRKDSGRSSDGSSVVTHIRLEHSAAPGGGSTFVWTAEPTFFMEFGLPRQVIPTVEAALSLSDAATQEIRYRLDDDGVWLGVDNPDELRTTVRRAIEAIAPIIGLSPEEAGEILGDFDDEGLGLVFANEPRLLHAPEGIEFSVGEVLTYSDQLPNAAGGRAFPAITSVEVLELIDDDGCVVIQQLTRPDPEQFSDILAESFADPESAAEFEALEIEVRVISQYDAGTGFLRRVELTRSFTTNAVERLGTVTIVDITDG